MIFKLTFRYRKIASSNTSRLEAHACFFRLLMKRIFDPYVLCPFSKKLIFYLVTRIRTRDYTVFKSKMIWSQEVTTNKTLFEVISLKNIYLKNAVMFVCTPAMYVTTETCIQ
jgi:hypothetical protein